MHRPPLAVVLACGFLLLSPLRAAGSEPLIEQVKKAVVFVGRITPQDKKQFVEIKGTGCLLNIEDFYYLLIPRHLLLSGSPEDPKATFNDRNLIILRNKKDGDIAYQRIEKVKKQRGVDWVFHPNPKVDLAVIPLLLNVTRDDIKTIPESFFFGSEGLHELDNVFFLSYQPGAGTSTRINPVIRKGAISRINDDGTLLIDGFAFHGNSGSPVFLPPTPFYLGARGTIESGDDGRGGRFIGIIGGYVKDREMAIRACPRYGPRSLSANCWTRTRSKRRWRNSRPGSVGVISSSCCSALFLAHLDDRAMSGHGAYSVGGEGARYPPLPCLSIRSAGG